MGIQCDMVSSLVAPLQWNPPMEEAVLSVFPNISRENKLVQSLQMVLGNHFNDIGVLGSLASNWHMQKAFLKKTYKQTGQR